MTSPSAETRFCIPCNNSRFASSLSISALTILSSCSCGTSPVLLVIVADVERQASRYVGEPVLGRFLDQPVDEVSVRSEVFDIPHLGLFVRLMIQPLRNPPAPLKTIRIEHSRLPQEVQRSR